MAYEFLKLDRRGHVATITLDRPDRLNALNEGLIQDLHAALDEVAKEFPDLRVVILTGAGRGFCSGGDVSLQVDLGARREDTTGSGASDIATLAPHIRQVPQAAIAAVNGVAVGAGLSIALACDIRIASEAARFSSIFIKRGLAPDVAASYTLPAQVGPGIAAEMALTGRIYDAPWALQVGLVNRVVTPDRLLEEARALAEEIAANPPLAMKATKELLYAAWKDLNAVVGDEHRVGSPLWGTEDQREAAKAFLEKREATFKGR